MATLGAFLAQLRANVARTGGAAHAEAAVALAEAEPLFGNRIPEVRAAIEAAGAALDSDPRPELKARLMARLAQQKMVEQDFDAADKALARVGDLVPTHTALRFLVGVRACRVAIRRGPEARAQARDLLITSAARLPQFQADDAIWQMVASELALGMAEAELHEEVPAEITFDALKAIVDEYATDPAHADAVFAGRQILVAYALLVGDGDAAMKHTRALVELATSAAGYTDEVEVRLSLASMLSNGDLVQRQEAAHHVQRARDRALEHGLDAHYQLALVAQAGVMSDAGKTAGAIDRVLEVARTAVAKGSVNGYVDAVGLMSAIYAKSGDVASAFRTIAEANQALGAALGKDTSHMFTPLLKILGELVGPAKLEQIAADVSKANQLAAELAQRERNDPA